MTVVPRLQHRVATAGIARRTGIDIVGDEQIQIAIAIDVEECAARSPLRIRDTRLGRDVSERTLAGVAIEHVRSQVRDVKIVPAVVVDVAGTGALPVGGVPYASLHPALVECAVTSIGIQPMPGRNGHGGCQRPTIHQEDVQASVVVVVEQHCAGPHRLDQELLRTRAIGVDELDAGSGGAVPERDRRCLARAAGLPGCLRFRQHEGGEQCGRQCLRLHRGPHGVRNSSCWRTLNSRAAFSLS